MRALRAFAAACVLALAAGSAGAAGFEGLRPDPPGAPKAQAGEIAAVDADMRTLRIGGNTFTVPPTLAVDFDALEVGAHAVVRYTEEGSRLIAIGIQRVEPSPQ
jgi:hypothetical protein